MQRSKVLFSQMARARITHRLHQVKKWKGTRSGVRVEFTLSDQPTLTGDRVMWRARFRGSASWKQGSAGTVWDAIGQIEKEAAK